MDFVDRVLSLVLQAAAQYGEIIQSLMFFVGFCRRIGSLRFLILVSLMKRSEIPVNRARPPDTLPGMRRVSTAGKPTAGQHS